MNHSGTQSTTEPPGALLTLARLDRLDPDRSLPGRNGTKADILKYTVDGCGIALKDYRRRPALVRSILGRYLIRRESLGYLSVGDVEGVPRFLGRLGPVTLATEWIDAVPLARFAGEKAGSLPEQVFLRLDRILDRLHQRKIALSDLHHRDVLVSKDGNVHLIDLAMAYRFREKPAVLRPFRRWLFGHLCRLDRIAAARMRARFTGGDMDEAVEQAGGRTAVLYRAGRKIKAVLRGRQK